MKYGGLRFLEAAHVKDLICLFRLADNPRDELAWFRLLQLLDGVGPVQARGVRSSALGVDQPGTAAEVLMRWPLAVEELPPASRRAADAFIEALRRRRRRVGRFARRAAARRARAVDRRPRTTTPTRGSPISTRSRTPRTTRPGSPTSPPISPSNRRNSTGDLAGTPVDRRGLARDLDRALGEGPRVGCGASAQRRRRELPLRHGAHDERGARRGTASLLRRGHPAPTPSARLRAAAVPLPAPRPRRRSRDGPAQPVPLRRPSPTASTRCTRRGHDSRRGVTIDAGVRVEMELDALAGREREGQRAWRN